MSDSRDFLRSEGFVFGETPDALDDRFLALFSRKDAKHVKAVWRAIHLEALDSSAMYGLPQTLEQAHVLFSHDVERYGPGFDWFLEQAVAVEPGTIVEMGCGTGTLLRYLASRLPGVRCTGIDGAVNLVAAAPNLPNISLIGGDYVRAEAAPFRHDLLICNFGFDKSRLLEHDYREMDLEDWTVPEPREIGVEQVAEMLEAWSCWCAPGARMLVSGRVAGWEQMSRWQLAAQRLGRSIDPDSLRLLRTDGGEWRFPAFAIDARDHGGIDRLKAAYEKQVAATD